MADKKEIGSKSGFVQPSVCLLHPETNLIVLMPMGLRDKKIANVLRAMASSVMTQGKDAHGEIIMPGVSVAAFSNQAVLITPAGHSMDRAAVEDVRNQAKSIVALYEAAKDFVSWMKMFIVVEGPIESNKAAEHLIETDAPDVADSDRAEAT